MKKILFLFAAITFGFCNSFSKKQGGTRSFFYADIDMFNMKGKKLINGNKPIAPCFEIESIDADNIRLTYWHSDKNRYSRSYSKQGNYWVTYYPVRADTLDLIVHNYVGKDRIIQLEYQDDSLKDNLRIATVYKDSFEKIFHFKPNFRIKTNGDVDFENKIFTDQIEGKGIAEYHIRKGNLQVIRTTVINSPESPIRDTSYYKIDDHSVFWWEEFGK